MLAVTAFFDYSGLTRRAEPALEGIRSLRRLEDMTAAVNQSQDQLLILLDEDYNILASSFPQVGTVMFL